MISEKSNYNPLLAAVVNHTSMIDWTNHVKRVVSSDPVESKAVWIYARQVEKRGVEIQHFTPEQYKATCNEGQSSWTKLSLPEIVNLSVIAACAVKSHALFLLCVLINSNQVDDKYEKNIQANVTELKTNTLAKELMDSLQILMKKEAAKYSSVENEEMNRQLTQFVEEGICREPDIEAKLHDALQERIFMNMEWFEDCIHFTGSEEKPAVKDLSLDEMRKRFATPQDVESKWIAEFNENSGKTFQVLTTFDLDHATQSWSRLSTVTQVWKNLRKVNK